MKGYLIIYLSISLLCRKIFRRPGGRSMLRIIIRFLKDEEGQTSTEYILLVAVVAMIVFKFRGIAMERLQAITEQVFSQASEQIKL